MQSKYSTSLLSRFSRIPSFIWLLVFSSVIVTYAIWNLRPNFFDESQEVLLNDTIILTDSVNQVQTHEDHIIKTEGCKIPYFSLQPNLSKKYFNFKYNGVHCNHGIPALVESNLTSLFINETSFNSYGIARKSELICCYKELLRAAKPTDYAAYMHSFDKVCIGFKDSIVVHKEFVYVQCSYMEDVIYEDYFSFVPRKYNPDVDQGVKKFNVLMMGLDAVSRLNIHRQMPQTVNLIQNLGFVEFFGYNKIADNTYPNLIAVLTGKDKFDIFKTCLSNGYFDNCKMIWDTFKAQKYVTSFCEDSVHMGLFNFQHKGFKKQPTDYMWGFFDFVAEKLAGNSYAINVFQCIGSREVYKMIVQYIHDFTYRMNSWKLPYFALFWSASLSHDNLNKPRIGDSVYTKLFQNMFDKGYFENTIVIFMSDHGLRYGKFRQTYQGSMEERLPFLFIRLPKEFKTKYPLATSNLRVNSKRLTTPFDLYETLKDIAHPKSLTDNFIAKKMRKERSSFGVSLFSQIPTSRTCEDAGIADHWCTCLVRRKIDITEEVHRVALHVIHHLNDRLEMHPECAQLSLSGISRAEHLEHKKEMKKKIFHKEFLINFSTLEGGLFEATVRVYNKTMELVGTISRLDLYGKRSSCVSDSNLKLFCFCK